MNESHSNQKLNLQCFPYEFPQIINIPITETKVTCTVSSLKNKTSRSYDGLYNKY